MFLNDKGQAEEAISEFRLALQIVPENPFTHYEFALVLGDNGKQEEAIEHFRESIRLKPDFFPLIRSWVLSFTILGNSRLL